MLKNESQWVAKKNPGAKEGTQMDSGNQKKNVR